MNPLTTRHAKPVGRAAPAERRARTTLRGPFIASVGIAILLNGVLVSGLAMSAQKWHVATRPSRHVTWVTAVATPTSLNEHTRGEQASQGSSPPSTAPLPRPALAGPASNVNAPDVAAAGAPAQDVPVASDGGTNVRFYGYREVDRAAEPDSDWNLEAALLDGAGLKTLVFEVFISAEGQVISVTILQPDDLPAEMRGVLEERLRQTTLRPAIRAGLNVPSVRRIELSVE